MELTQFMNVISQLVFRACDVIKTVYESQTLNVKMKGQLNPVTIADMTIQSMIVKHLTTLWPCIQIVGQETITSDSGLCSVIQQEINNHTDFFKSYFESTTLNLEDFCVWIDPLDGTLSFTRGRLQDVTVMVGVSYKQKARIGVIGIPYQNSSDNDCYFNPRVVMSDSNSQSVIQINRDFSTIKPISDLKTHPNRLVISRGLPIHQTKMLKNISSETVEAYAMGNKFIRMIKEKAAGLVYIGAVASLWDTCAGQALVRSLGGVVTNLLGNDIIYDNHRTTFELGNGIVCAFQQQMMDNINSQLSILAQVN